VRRKANTFTIDRRHQERAGGGGNRALLVESVKVPSRIRKDLFQTAFGNGNAGQLGNGLHLFQKRVLYGGLAMPEPRRFQRRGSSYFPPSTPKYTSAGFDDDRTDDRAFGADDVVCLGY
jgi:hypothetical protein